MTEKNLYYKKPIQKHVLASLQRRSYYIIHQTEKGLGVTHRFVNKLREDVLIHLGKKAFWYLESQLDAPRAVGYDYGWGVYGSFSWKALERAGMTRNYTK